MVTTRYLATGPLFFPVVRHLRRCTQDCRSLRFRPVRTECRCRTTPRGSPTGTRTVGRKAPQAGQGLQGTLAEFIAADAALLARKPSNLSARDAAALPLSTITAWEGLVDRARVRPGQKVLVHAGAGGVGHIAVQIARAFGAKVFATVSPDKAEIVKGFCATPIDYRSLSVEQYVAAHTEGRGFDIVYDTVGGATLDASFAAVKRYTGHALSCLGWGSHSLAPLSFRGATYSGVFTLLPLITGEGRAHHGEILAEAAALVQAGKLTPFLHAERFSPSRLDAAYALVASGSLGKVVVEL